MYGMMMNVPLTISSILEHAENFNHDAEIVSRKPEGGIHRYTYRDAAKRSRKLANALKQLGVNFQDRVATLAWNTHRHYELYYAVSGSGAIIHTINPRLFPDQIVYIINHAEDIVLFVDLTFVPLVEKIFPKLTTLQHVVVMAGKEHLPDSTLPLIAYEDLIEAQKRGLRMAAVR